MRQVCIELRKVYRQNDPEFIGILDNIRISQVSDRQLSMLNTRVGAEVDNNDGQLSITLSTLRDTVDFINQRKLDELEGARVSMR